MRVLTSLSIDSTTPDALRFYQDELGATVVVRLGTAIATPASGSPDNTFPAGHDVPHERSDGNNHLICISTDTAEEGERLFCALSAEGSITVAQEARLSNVHAGTLIDKFGNRWSCYS